jgi:hypothetical protein
MFGPRAPDRLQAFMLTVVIADDSLALVAIALFYSDSIDVRPLIWAAGLFAVVLVLLLGDKLRLGPPYFVLGARCLSSRSSRASSRRRWALRLGSWCRPRPPPARTSSRQESASGAFRERPTPELQRVARESLRTAVSPSTARAGVRPSGPVSEAEAAETLAGRHYLLAGLIARRRDRCVCGA